MKTLYSEGLKLIYAREAKIVMVLVTLCQALLAYLECSQFRRIGLDATPLTCEDLLEPIPPLEYMGFDAALFGIFAMIILGALTGAKEFRRKSLRSTLLATPSRGRVFLAKTAVLGGSAVLISFLSTYITLFAAHRALAGEGLNPALLNGSAWIFLGWTILSESLLTLLAYAMAVLFHGATFPLLFLLPQFYLAVYLPGGHLLGRLLPVTVSESLIAVSPEAFSKAPFMAAGLLLLYLAVVLALGIRRIGKEDLGRYEE